MFQEGPNEDEFLEQIPVGRAPEVKPKRKRRKIVESPKSGSQDSFQPDFNQYKKVGLPVDMKRVTIGSWGLEENGIYLNFLQNYRKDFETQGSRRKSTVFNRLSKALRKRTPDQCRSHHQKLQNRFHNNVQAIIQFVKGKISKQMLDSGDKNTKNTEAMKPTATSTFQLDEYEPLELDLSLLMIW